MAKKSSAILIIGLKLEKELYDTFNSQQWEFHNLKKNLVEKRNYSKILLHDLFDVSFQFTDIEEWTLMKNFHELTNIYRNLKSLLCSLDLDYISGKVL